DIILNAICGLFYSGLCISIILKCGASTGGMDIFALVLSRLRDLPVGTYFLLLNGMIIIVAGLLYEPENALYTILTLYITTRVIDRIHTRHEKVTAMVITEKAKELQTAIYNQMVRGITILQVQGAYSKEKKYMIYLVITRYELYDLEKIIKTIDPQAFTNIVETTEVFGSFR